MDERKQLYSYMRAIIGVLGVIVFVFILWLVETGNATGFDNTIRFAFYDIRTPVLTVIARYITYFGDWHVIVLACLVLLIIKPTRITYGVPLSIGCILVTVSNRVIKEMVERVRPEDITHLVSEDGFSFASGHAITSMFFFGMLIYLIRDNANSRARANTATVLLLIPMIFVGLSRIYLGVHYPTDILAGWCLGVTAIMIVIFIYHLIEARRERSREEKEKEEEEETDDEYDEYGNEYETQ